MKISYLIRRRRKRPTPSGSAYAHPEGEYDTPIKSGLTKIGAGDRMKKENEFFKVDQEGNIEQFSKKEVRSKTKQEKKIIEFKYFNLGFYILTPIILGIFLGLAIDDILKTKPIFFIFFLILGSLSSFYNLFKLAKNE